MYIIIIYHYETFLFITLVSAFRAVPANVHWNMGYWLFFARNIWISCLLINFSFFELLWSHQLLKYRINLATGIWFRILGRHDFFFDSWTWLIKNIKRYNSWLSSVWFFRLKMNYFLWQRKLWSACTRLVIIIQILMFIITSVHFVAFLNLLNYLILFSKSKCFRWAINANCR